MNVNSLVERFPLPPPPSSRVRLGLIGLGWVATRCHLPAIDFLRQQGWPVEVSAICELRNDRLAPVAQMYPEAKTFTSVTRMLESRTFDALLILTMPNSCADLLEIGLHHGVPIFVEKPVSNELKRVEELGALAKSLHARVQVGYNRRHQPLVPSFLSMIEEETAPIHLLARFWRTGRREDTFFANTATHPLDFLASVFGPLRFVSAKMHDFVPGANIPACVRIDLAGRNNTTLELDIRPAASRFEESYEAVSTDRSFLIRYCHTGRTNGPAELSACQADRRETFFFMDRRKIAQERLAPEFLSGFIHQMAGFCRLAVDAGDTNLCKLDDAVEVLKLQQAIAKDIGWARKTPETVLTAA